MVLGGKRAGIAIVSALAGGRMKSAIVAPRPPPRIPGLHRHPCPSGVGGTMHEPLPSSEHQPKLPFTNAPPARGVVPTPRPGSGRADRFDLAKWPPDDDDLPGGGAPAQPMGGGGGGPMGPYDADFRKGRFNPKIVMAFILVAVAGALLAVFALKSESAKMTADQIAAIKKNVYVLPKAERAAKWRDLADKTDEYELQQEALIQLGWEGDKSAVPLAIKALGQIDHRIRGVAAQVLAY